ncbi:uncharacterized protein AtWU_08782 [Aspergillus tubingensis]|uniref:uncharacterized protein n=1 Tax=Aspergillus tubingensis TaxID=5068 RepID=UPI0015781C64|nr:uncharacterized protein AtWU_08782 [Aspergillus tubingensis]GFN18979.1 hypothetical protein AtWU_08782 [Aspergillus tubingensis]
MHPHRLHSLSSGIEGVHKVDLSNIPDPQSLRIRLGTQMVMISPRPLVEAWRRSRPEGALEHVQAVLPTSGPSCHTGSHVHVGLSLVLSPLLGQAPETRPSYSIVTNLAVYSIGRHASSFTIVVAHASL